MTQELITIKIDGNDVQCEKGARLIDVIRKAGTDVPSFCYYPGLKVTANCRMCLVSIKGQKKLAPSCNTPVTPGLEVSTINDEIKETRKTVLEMILVNHPLDCPVCDKAGECELQDRVMEYGPADTSFRGKKRVYDMIDIGDKIWRDMDRCIYCRRCDLYMQDVEKVDNWAILERGAATEMGPYFEQKVEGKTIGNLADLCPVGALVDKQYFCSDRSWKLRYVDAKRKCGNCCGEVTLSLDEKNKVRRVTARMKNYVVQNYICDVCRYDKTDLKNWEIEKVYA